jgi:hypothetical protein
VNTGPFEYLTFSTPTTAIFTEKETVECKISSWVRQSCFWSIQGMSGSNLGQWLASLSQVFIVCPDTCWDSTLKCVTTLPLPSFSIHFKSPYYCTTALCYSLLNKTTMSKQIMQCVCSIMLTDYFKKAVKPTSVLLCVLNISHCILSNITVVYIRYTQFLNLTKWYITITLKTLW